MDLNTQTFLGLKLSISQILIHLVLKTLLEDKTYYYLISLMRSLRHREVKSVAQDCTTNPW